MALPIDDILSESLEYYRILKRQMVGRLLINAKGSLRRKKVGEHSYYYLRKNKGKRYHESYIGKENDPSVSVIQEELENRKKAIISLRESKGSLKKLRVDSMELKNEDYIGILRDLIDALEKEGLWEEAVQLIGSWCFKVYQVNCGVEYYPERTLDIDFAVKLPYRGQPVDVGEILKSLGLEERYNRADGSVSYVSGEFSVEFLQHRKGSGKSRQEENPAKDLGLVPQAIPYLNILLENGMRIEARDLGRVVVPSLAAFFLHKLLVADARSGPKRDKKRKDYQQVEAVAKAILRDEALVDETRTVASGLHKKWQQKIAKSCGQMAEYLPALGVSLHFHETPNDHPSASAILLERINLL